jgi:Protein of unknown function (DUF1573)
MSNGVKIGLLAVIAVALGFLAVKAWNGNDETIKSRSASADTSGTGSNGSLQNPKPNTFYPVTNGKDPLASGTPVSVGEQGKPTTQSTVGEKSKALPKTTVKWAEMSHDFGKVKQGDRVEYTFKFTNVGTEPLIIEDCKAGCGCTVPTWPKEPVLPGKSDVIKVSFNSAGKQGPQTKDVTVTANTDNIQTKLTIKAQVDGGATGATSPSGAKGGH